MARQKALVPDSPHAMPKDVAERYRALTDPVQRARCEQRWPFLTLPKLRVVAGTDAARALGIK